jgi:uncharacterized protein (DUF952 family)
MNPPLIALAHRLGPAAVARVVALRPRPLARPIWKILTTPQLERLIRDGIFDGAPVDLADGYVHLSAPEQVEGTLARHFVGQTGLWLLALDADVLGAALRWEPSRGGALFPHLYAPLRWDDVGLALPREASPFSGEPAP